MWPAASIEKQWIWLSMSQTTGSISPLFHVFQDDWLHFLELQRMIGSISSILQYDWQRPGDGGFSVLAITTEWSLHPDWQQPGNVVPPPWLSELNGVSTQTGSIQVMWLLCPDHHSWMASPPKLAAPRWCGSSAQTITAKWRFHPDWQHPGDVVPPLGQSPLNGVSTQTGSTQVMWFLRPDRHSWMASPPRLAASRWCGSSALTITAEWSLHPDWQHPGDVVPPPWLSQLNGLSTQTGSIQVMWFLRPDHHSWMVSPPRLAAPRWCGSSALTVTAEWPLHPDWQHPGDVFPPLRPSQLNGFSAQTGSTQVMWFLRSDHHSRMVSPPRLVTPRWCVSSTQTITTEWILRPDW